MNHNFTYLYKCNTGWYPIHWQNEKSPKNTTKNTDKNDDSTQKLPEFQRKPSGYEKVL